MDLPLDAITLYNFMAITWPDIRNFVLGMLTGFVLLTLTIALLLVGGRRSRKKILMSREAPLDDKTVRAIVEEKQKELIDTVKFTDNAYFRVALDLSMELMQEIAHHYFPDSKYPMYELSIQEILDLTAYVTKRVEKIVDGKFLRLFKNSRISTIINILEKKKALDNSKLMKLSRKYHVSKLYSMSRAILNYANPIYWFRKLTIKPSVTLVTKEVCKMIIEIVGEETNKIYSKKLFAEPDDETLIEAKVDEIFGSETEGESKEQGAKP
ncbi:MAG: hypothetical protein PHI01_04060 [Candidatus Izemoplasmatales bacterium]|nr:hypothetical protein [Candidatus Izemoplasmatales bacterium]